METGTSSSVAALSPVRARPLRESAQVVDPTADPREYSLVKTATLDRMGEALDHLQQAMEARDIRQLGEAIRTVATELAQARPRAAAPRHRRRRPRSPAAG